MKKFENIVIASDLDGTFFGSTQYLIERNTERIRYFCDNGGHFTFATGRLPLFIRKPIPEPQKYINMPAVMGNGTCIYDYLQNRAVEEHFLDTYAAIDIIKYAKQLESEVGSRATFPNGFAVSDMSNSIIKREYERLPDFMDKRILPIDEWHTLDLYKANIMGSAECIERLYPVLREKYSHAVGVTRSASFMIELVPLGITKAVALKKLVDNYFDRPMTLYCVGDYDNDIEMLKLADVSVCPSNANDNVKAICKHCLCSNDEGVIGDLIDLIDSKTSL
ncbi:MAG: HAD hydrolase family protein [Clostridia bacterium]|nr:HAD hydrolase family protein [Clostridia bacterium]